MKDPRFLPIESREPVEEYEDDFLESDDDEMYELLTHSGKTKDGVKKLQLYIAS